VPALRALAAAMEKDDALCRSFFRNLGRWPMAARCCPDDLYERIVRRSRCGRPPRKRIVFYTGWGSYRDRADLDRAYWDNPSGVGLIGLPFPARAEVWCRGAKYELRLLRRQRHARLLSTGPILTEAASTHR